jgi:hypothetical protein
MDQNLMLHVTLRRQLAAVSIRHGQVLNCPTRPTDQSRSFYRFGHLAVPGTEPHYACIPFSLSLAM